jgi:hypothetical protein
VNKAELTEDCHRAIFNVVKQELQDSSVDYTLLTTCKNMIRLFCHEEDPSQALVCLKVSLYNTVSYRYKLRKVWYSCECHSSIQLPILPLFIYILFNNASPVTVTI